MKRFKPGVSFPDFVVQDFSTTRGRIKDDGPRDYRRGWLVWMMILIAFGVLFARLAVVQIFRGETYEVLADENRIQTLKIPAPRGVIFDRTGRELAVNETYIWKDELGHERQALRRLYPYKEAVGQVLGYIGEVKEDEVGLVKEAGKKYTAGDMVGRMGLEQTHEVSLRGMDGGKLVEVDNVGEAVRNLGQKDSIKGDELKTNIDAELSRVAYDGLMKSKVKKGAAVIANPQTGEILGLVSAPGFDPNIFSRSSKDPVFSSDELTAVLTDTNLPLFNRAIGGVYAPGSTFKMNTTIAAIESGKVKADFSFVDAGVISVGTFRFTNWLFTKHGGTEGAVGFVRSITRSTDTFFYKVGELTGPEEIANWAHKLGMGVKTGIDLPGEATGIVGTPETRRELYKTAWYLGDTYHMAIGQADTLLTPLQVNVMTNVLASDGEFCKPYVVAGEPDCKRIAISDKTLKIVKEGMIGACSPGGTAFPLFDWNEAAKNGLSVSTYTKGTEGVVLPVIACKTGTAEYVAENGKMRTHAWLTAYAPAENPTISATVLIEGGGEGSNAAAPIVRQIFAKYFGVTDTYPYANIPQEVSE